MRSASALLTVVLFSSVLCSAPAGAGPILLNEFFSDPTVSVAADGSSATFAEEAGSASVILSDDPSLGDADLILAGIGVVLRFDYDFFRAPDNVDEFFAFLFDADTRETLASWACVASCAGSATADLSVYLLRTLGLEFQLNSVPPNDNGTESTLRISNVALSEPVVSVPEPPSWALLSAALVGAFVWRRRRTAA